MREISRDEIFPTPKKQVYRVCMGMRAWAMVCGKAHWALGIEGKIMIMQDATMRPATMRPTHVKTSERERKEDFYAERAARGAGVGVDGWLIHLILLFPVATLHLWFPRVLLLEKKRPHSAQLHSHTLRCFATSWRRRSCWRLNCSLQPRVQGKQGRGLGR